jgi:hypothetical protein
VCVVFFCIENSLINESVVLFSCFLLFFLSPRFFLVKQNLQIYFLSLPMLLLLYLYSRGFKIIIVFFYNLMLLRCESNGSEIGTESKDAVFTLWRVGVGAWA